MPTTPILAIPYADPSSDMRDYPTLTDLPQAQRVEALLTTAPIAASYALTTDLGIAAATDVTVNFQTAYLSDPTNLPYAAGVVTVKVAGLYLLTGSLFYDKPPTGAPRVYVSLQQNNATNYQQITVLNSAWNYSTLPFTALKRAAVNDTFKVIARCDIAATVKANTTGFQSSFSLVRLGA